MDETVSTVDPQLKQALYELSLVEQELARRRKANGITYFIPNPPQLQALHSSARIVAYCGGNRAGKSECGAAWLSAHLTHRYPACACHGEWFGTRRYDRPLKAVIVSTEFPIIERVIEPKLMKLLPKEWIAPNGIKRTPQGYLRLVRGVDGGTIDILSNEMDQMAFEGADWDLAWIDEPTSKSRYVAIHRGLTDREGLMMLTFTPIVEPWMKADVIDRADDKMISVVQADTYANLADIHGHPIQTKDAIAFFEEQVPEEERATRIHGQFFHLKGMVYKEYSPPVHEKLFEYQYPDPVIAVMDPHDRLPHHILWAFLDRQDKLYIDRELLIHCPPQELKRAILITESQAGYKMRARYIDPNFGATPIVGGRTLIQELMTPPLRVQFTPACDDKTQGHIKVKDYLHYNRLQPISLTNTPRLFFHATRVPKTIQSIKNYQFEEWQGKSRELKDPKEKERGKDSHGADCIRYLCMANLQFEHLTSRSHEYELADSAY